MGNGLGRSPETSVTRTRNALEEDVISFTNSRDAVGFSIDKVHGRCAPRVTMPKHYRAFTLNAP